MVSNNQTTPLQKLTQDELKTLRIEAVSDFNAFLKSGNFGEPLLAGELYQRLSRLEQIVACENTGEAREQLKQIQQVKTNREFTSIHGYRQYKNMKQLSQIIWGTLFGILASAFIALFIINHISLPMFILVELSLMILFSKPMRMARRQTKLQQQVDEK